MVMPSQRAIGQVATQMAACLLVTAAGLVIIGRIADRKRAERWQQEAAKIEAMRLKALQDVEDRRTEIEGAAVVKALGILQSGELDRPGGAEVKRFPAQRESGHQVGEGQYPS